MIKIIEHGTIKRKRCENCGCLFSYEKEDVEYNTHCDFSEINNIDDKSMKADILGTTYKIK